MPVLAFGTDGIRGLSGKLRERLERPMAKRAYPPFHIHEPRHIIVLPHLNEREKIDIRYPLLEPFVSVRVHWDKQEKRLLYTVSEPALSAKERETFRGIASHLTEVIDIKMSVIRDREKAMSYLEKKIHCVMDDLGIELENDAYIRILYYVFRNFVGLNEIEPLMHDPYIEDIGCSGMDTQVYITHRKFGSLITNINFTDFNVLSDFVIKLSERCGRYISYAMPLLDGTLPDGSRVQSSLAKDVTTKGPTFSIRRFRKNPFSPIDIINFGSASSSLMAYLWFMIDNNASMLVVGGVSTGKTTFLNVLSMFIPPENKIVSIEDVREINISHDNWIPATSRSGFGVPDAEGKRYGEIKLFDLLKESFRMKPDYVIVGEVRGKEAYVLFQGMASGNPSLGTMHSGSVDDVIKRLETPPIELSPSLIESLDVLIVMVNARKRGTSARRVKEVVEIESMDVHTGKAHTTTVFAWIPSADDFRDNSQQSLLLRKVSFEKGIPYEQVVEDLHRRKRVIEWMEKFHIVQFEDVGSIIDLYHKEPGTIMAQIDSGLPPAAALRSDAAKRWKSVTGLKLLPERL